MTMIEQIIPLAKLRPGAMNVRGDHAPADIKAMAANISAEGQMVAIEVRPIAGSDEFEITDGHLRFAALKRIAGKKGGEARCVVNAVSDAVARRRSLTANVMRIAMHPVDEYEAYAALKADGLVEPAIADLFGIDPSDVRKRLRLADLAPEVRDAWRSGKIDADQAKAFAASSDQDRQRAVLKAILKAKDYWLRSADHVRRELTSGMMNPETGDVIFIGGVEAYVAAGGEVEEDLFKGVTLLKDGALVKRLVRAKLEAEAARLVAEGWAWAKPKSDVENWYLLPKPDLMATATPAEKAALKGKDWKAERDATAAILKRLNDDPTFRATAGLLLFVDHEGKLMQHGPFTAADEKVDDQQQDDDQASEDAGEDQRDDESAEMEAEAGPATPWPMREALSLGLTAATGSLIKGHPSVALAALTATLRIRLEHMGATPLRLDPDNRQVSRPDQRTSGDWATAFAELESGPVDRLMAEMAAHVATLLDLRDLKMDDRNHRGWNRGAAIQALAAALPGPAFSAAITERFDPEVYFKAVPIALIDEAVTEMTGRPTAKSLTGKKAKADFATSVATTSGWIPKELRTVHYTGPGSQTWAATREAAE